MPLGTVPQLGMKCAWCKTSDGGQGIPWIGPQGSDGNWQQVFHNGAAPRNCYDLAKAAGVVQ